MNISHAQKVFIDSEVLDSGAQMKPAEQRPIDVPAQSDRIPLLQDPVANVYRSNEKNVLGKESESLHTPHHEAEIGQTAQSGSLSEKGQKASRTYSVVIFCLTAGLLFADQNLMAPNLSSIAECTYKSSSLTVSGFNNPG